MADQNFDVNCGFFDSIDNDRLYSADDMNKPYKRIVADGVFATPQGTPSTDLCVLNTGSDMKITVSKGEGIFGGKWFENPYPFAISVPANTSANPRRDSVIVQVDTRLTGRTGRIVYRTGTPSTNPVPPAIGLIPSVIEYRIANIYLDAYESARILRSNVIDLRGSSECPWVTGLIEQVDTSQLYSQWNAAYESFYNQEFTRVEDFMQTLTQELNVTMNLTTLQSSYISTSEVTQIPINISGYNKNRDILHVYINGLKAVEGSRYTVASGGTYITLNPSITAGQRVDFLVYKSIVGADSASALEQLAQLSNTVSSLNTAVSALNSDGGWINFTLEGGATAYSDSVKPAVRKYGNRTNIRGAIKGVTAAGTVVCTLPAAYKPAMDYVYTTTAVSGSSVTATITMHISASTGQVKLLAKTGTIGASDMVSIATDFIVG